MASGEGTNGEPRDVDHSMCVSVTSPRPPGRIASVGPARPEVQKTRPASTTGVGMTSKLFPPQRHSSRPVSGSYAFTVRWLLTTSSSWSPTRIATGDPQPTLWLREVLQICSPVAVS